MSIIAFNAITNGCTIARIKMLLVVSNALINGVKILLMSVLIDLISFDIVLNGVKLLFPELLPSDLFPVTSVVVFSVLAAVVEMVANVVVLVSRLYRAFRAKTVLAKNRTNSRYTRIWTRGQ